MTAQEAIQIADSSQAAITKQHGIVCDEIKATAELGKYHLKMLATSVPKKVQEILNQDGFDVSESGSLVIIEWKKPEIQQQPAITAKPTEVVAVTEPATEVKPQPSAPAIKEPAAPVAIPTKRIAFLGNFNVDYTSETHHMNSLAALGHQVFKLQEGKQTSQQILSMAKQCQLFVWVHTHGWGTPGSKPMRQVLAELKQLGIPTMSYHLDLWKGLKREVDMQKDEVWDIEHFFTVDKLMADWFNEQKAQGGKTTGHYLPAGVYHKECQLQPRTTWENDVIFVGARGYHSEWPYRVTLLDWLTGNYKERFRHFGGEENTRVRGQALNDLYAKTKIVIGDTLCIDFKYPYYYSDRIFETIGRGGFIIHPYIKGLDEIFEDKKHLVFYEYNNFGQLKELIDYYLTHDEEREAIRKAGHEHVKANHTYLNRWRQIMSELFAPKLEEAQVTDGVIENSAVS